MKIIEKYLFREIIIPYVFCLIITLSLLLMGRIIQIARYILQTSVSFSDILLLMILAIPKLSLYALPLATMLSVALAVNRMNSDKEMIAMQASGISFRNLWRPIFIFALINTLLAMFFSTIIMPRSNALFRKKLGSIGAASVTAILREGVFIDIVPGFVFYFQKVQPSNFTAHGIFVEDLRNSKVSINIVAKKAKISYSKENNTVSFSLYDGTITRIPLKNKSKGQAVFFHTYRISLPVSSLGIWKNPVSGGKNEMTMKQLKEAIKVVPSHMARRFEIEYWLRILLPLSCIILAFLTLPLFVIGKIESILVGLSITIFIYLGYYFLISLGKGLAENGIIPVKISMWLPVLSIMLVTSYIWKRS